MGDDIDRKILRKDRYKAHELSRLLRHPKIKNGELHVRVYLTTGTVAIEVTAESRTTERFAAKAQSDGHALRFSSATIKEVEVF